MKGGVYRMLTPEGAESERDGGDTVRAETGRTLGGHPVHDPLVPLRRGRDAQTG